MEIIKVVDYNLHITTVQETRAIDGLVGKKPFKDYSTHRQRSFFQGSSQPHLASSLAEGWNIQDWKEEIVGRFCILKTDGEHQSRGHQIQVSEPC